VIWGMRGMRGMQARVIMYCLRFRFFSPKQQSLYLRRLCIFYLQCGAGKVSRCVLPFRAQRWHFWCHVLCRYVAFCACCLASGHVVTTFPAGISGRFVQWTQMFQVMTYSTLYLIHIHVVCFQHVSTHIAAAIANWAAGTTSCQHWRRI